MPKVRAPSWPVWVILVAMTGLASVPLPDVITPLRPPLAAMAIIYWTMMWPRVFGLGSAWLVGLILDVLYGDLLGQHALALSVVAYLTMKFHLQIRIFPLWQLTATVFSLLAIEAFILFWIDGVAGNPPAGITRWTQVLAGAILWPVVMALMDRVRERLEHRDTTFM